MSKLISALYASILFGKVFHSVVHCLQQEMRDCATVLDVGCGPSSPIQYCKNVKYSVGVEIFKSYLEESKKKKIHNKYINKKIEDLEFKEGEFDAVMMVEVLEHLDKKTAREVLKKVEKWASKKVIVTTPNGFVEQKTLDENLYQTHLSGWSLAELQELGFECKGLAGLKLLRNSPDKQTLGEDLTISIRFRPKWFWFGVAAVSQLLTYYFPGLAFELFAVKRI